MSNLMIGSFLALGATIWGFVLLICVNRFSSSEFERNGYMFAEVIPETADEEFEFAGRPNYAGLRDRVKQLQADEVARLG